MKAVYDRETDTLHLTLREGTIESSEEIRPGVILDFDAEGNVVSIEILDASQRTHAPNCMEFAVATPSPAVL